MWGKNSIIAGQAPAAESSLLLFYLRRKQAVNQLCGPSIQHPRSISHVMLTPKIIKSSCGVVRGKKIKIPRLMQQPSQHQRVHSIKTRSNQESYATSSIYKEEKESAFFVEWFTTESVFFRYLFVSSFQHCRPKCLEKYHTSNCSWCKVALCINREIILKFLLPDFL